MTRQPRRIVREAHCGIIPSETEKGVAKIIDVEDADIVIDNVGDVQEDLDHVSTLTRRAGPGPIAKG